MATLRRSVITERVMALLAARDDRAVCVPCLAVLADTSERLMRTELPGEARQRRDEREADLQDVAKRLAGTFSSHVDGESGRQMIRK